MADLLPATIIERVEWSDKLFSLRLQAPFLNFKAGQFVLIALDINGERIKRPYSLVNAPGDNIMEIYFNVVDEGPLSPRLATLQPGDNLFISGSASGLMVLDEIPPAQHLWLFASGTGIGPFLSLMNTAEPWMRFNKIVLSHTVRFAAELSYGKLINTLLASYPDQMRYVPIVTRETSANTLHQRIQIMLASGELETFSQVTLSAENSHVMLCGNANMITDVSDELGKRGLRRHRRREPGHITIEKYH